MLFARDLNHGRLNCVRDDLLCARYACSYLLAHFVSNCGTGSTVVDKGSLRDGSTCIVAIERLYSRKSLQVQTFAKTCSDEFSQLLISQQRSRPMTTSHLLQVAKCSQNQVLWVQIFGSRHLITKNAQICGSQKFSAISIKQGIKGSMVTTETEGDHLWTYLFIG